MGNREVSRERDQDKEKDTFFQDICHLCLSKDAKQLPRLRVRKALLTNPKDIPLGFPTRMIKSSRWDPVIVRRLFGNGRP